MTPNPPSRTELQNVVVRFAGDSGDGVQMTGSQFTRTSALLGNDVSTLPDYPAEIRAPAGTVFGVSGFQIQFGAAEVRTPGDAPDVLVAFNPAALKANLDRVPAGGLVVVNTDAFTARNLKKAGYEANPLDGGSLEAWTVVPVAMTTQTREALVGAEIGKKDKDRAKNFYALGIVYYLYDRPLQHTVTWLEGKFAAKPEIGAANIAALKAGFYYAETAELFQGTYRVPEAPIAPGQYRYLTGNHATALGLVAGSRKADLDLFLGSYPITPASDILHALAAMRAHGVRTLQAEDEIAAICAAVGGSWAGNLGVTTTSGPGLALKGEALGLAMMLELPLVVVNVQRGGPSTGLPTKVEQSDLNIVLYGRNGDAPLPAIAATTPADCFAAAFEAVRITIEYRTPVVLVTDGYLANGSEPWAVVQADDLPAIDPKFGTDPEGFQPYARDPETLARAWVVPGTPGMEHRVGGLEKDALTGEVSYDPGNHQRMSELRAEKVARIAREIPPLAVFGEPEGDLLVVGWGGTFGSIRSAVAEAQEAGQSVSHAHIRWLNPLNPDLGEVMGRFRRVLVPELNMGQFADVLRKTLLADVTSYTKVQGQPFQVGELRDAIDRALKTEA